MSLTVSELLHRRFHDILTHCNHDVETADVETAAAKIDAAYKAAGRQVTVLPDPDRCSLYLGGGNDAYEEHLSMQLEYRDGEWFCESPGSDSLDETAKLMTWIDEESQESRILGHGVDDWSTPLPEKT